MNTAIAKTSAAQLARKEDGLSEDQVQLIKNTIAKGASDDELKLFISTSNRLRLDPFARQIFLVKRWDSQVNGYVATPQVSVDGFRLVAERTGQYRGQTAPEWCGKDGKWTDVWLADEPPAAARVGVFRDGFAQPLVRVALYRSYVQVARGKNGQPDRPNAMWVKYPEVMLAKCAESLALRSAFPNELSGVYTDSEMPEPSEAPAQRTSKPVRTLDDVARGGERAESRPTETTPTNTHNVSMPHPSSSALETDGELLDAKAWRSRFDAVVAEAVEVGIEFSGEDEYGLPIPAVDVPRFSSRARYANLSYNDPKVPCGLLRSIANHSDFGNDPLVKRLWTLRIIAVHEIEKERSADAQAEQAKEAV